MVPEPILGCSSDEEQLVCDSSKGRDDLRNLRHCRCMAIVVTLWQNSSITTGYMSLSLSSSNGRVVHVLDVLHPSMAFTFATGSLLLLLQFAFENLRSPTSRSLDSFHAP